MLAVAAKGYPAAHSNGMLIVLAFSLISLTLFLVGIILALLEIPLVWPAVLVVVMG